jgi:predicted alpha-1,2-mannosidase
VGIALDRLALTLALVALLSVAAPSTAVGASSGGLSSLVDVFVGSTNDGFTFPGASAPFGMIQFSPVTPTTPGAGYDYKDTSILGFTLNRLSGIGCPNLGAGSMLPVDDPTQPAPSFSHDQEFGTPGYYRVQLGSGVLVELSATTRTGIARFTFPHTTGYVEIAGRATDTRTIGGTQTIDTGLCGSGGTINTHYTVTFNQPFTAVSDGVLRFDLAANRTLIARAAISYVSEHNATVNLGESRTWDFDRVRAAAEHIWDNQLALVKVSGGRPYDRRTFYTALYHFGLAPSTYSDLNGEYLAGDGSVRRAHGYTRYTNVDGWGSYRTEYPLLCLLERTVARGVALSLLGYYKETGRLGKWAYASHESGVMIGDSFGILLADAIAFHLADIPVNLALEAMVHGATAAQPGPFMYPSRSLTNGTYVERPGLADYLRYGYVPFDHNQGFIWGAASTTLEYATDDFAISRVALAAGRPQLAAAFLARSNSWRTLVNPTSRFIEPRMADGSFIPGFSLTTETVAAFAEGNAWQYSWAVPQNVAGLVAALGGKASVSRRLDSFFGRLNAGPNAPYAWLGNEHDFQTPWIYLWLGQPRKTAAVVRRVQRLFTLTPGGLPGNDDLGQMSAWYIWSALGMYPMVPGVAGVVTTKPLFAKTVLTTSSSLTRWTDSMPSFAPRARK